MNSTYSQESGESVESVSFNSIYRGSSGVGIDEPPGAETSGSLSFKTDDSDYAVNIMGKVAAGAAAGLAAALLPLAGHYLQQTSVGRAYLLAHLSRGHLVNAMIFMTGRCLKHNLPLRRQTSSSSHSTPSVLSCTGKAMTQAENVYSEVRVVHAVYD